MKNDKIEEIIINDTWVEFFRKILKKVKNNYPIKYNDCQSLLKDCLKNSVINHLGLRDYTQHYRYYDITCQDVSNYDFYISHKRKCWMGEDDIDEFITLFLNKKNDYLNKIQEEIDKEKNKKKEDDFISFESIINIKF